MPTLKCPCKKCDFQIEIQDKDTWNKIKNLFVQHFLENHTLMELVEQLFGLVSDKTYDEQFMMKR